MYLSDGRPWSRLMMVETSMRTKAPRTAQSIHQELALDDDAGETDVPVLILGSGGLTTKAVQSLCKNGRSGDRGGNLGIEGNRPPASRVCHVVHGRGEASCGFYELGTSSD